MINSFITATYFKSFNGLDVSIDDNIIEPEIETAQEQYIKNYIGTALYNSLMEQIDNVSVSTDNATLLDNYIAPCLAKYTLYRVLPKIVYRIENIGIVKRTAENTEPISDKGLISLQQIAIDDAEFRAERLVKYLIANSGLYPLYLNAGTSQPFFSPNRK